VLVFLLAAVVGLSLGLLGAGGSILAVPILRYAGGLSAKEAIATSLATVGAVSLVGAILAWREGRLRPREASIFAAIASLGTVVGVRMAVALSDGFQMGLFLLVMVAALVFMVSADEAPLDLPKAKLSMGATWGKALGVGVLTGLVGVGGGFLIVPALMAIYRMPIKDATGTSLGVIAINSALGLLSYSNAIVLDWVFTAQFVGAAIAGLLVGLATGRKVEGRITKVLFQGSILVVALYTAWRELLALA
jgi:uncharacterized membrane protein YfcA